MFKILPENSIEPFGRLGKRRTTLNRARSILALLVSSLVIAAGMVSITPPHAAQAAVAVDFNPGLIISDSLFFDGGAMSASQVQEFLNVKVGACASGYTCLKSYRQDTPNKDAVVGRCGAYAGALAESAATIITKVGQTCGISQKALIVLLQKEQGLITSTAPSEWAYRAATGYGCPDTSVCDSLYYGFFNQVYMAASQFKRYAANPTGWNHVAGQVNQIRLHPNTACGSTAVYIENQATAGLYNYTPYKPNQAALANLYGTGDSCSSYGNRNFFRFYTDWFGSTQTTSLMRTAENATVYLVALGVKYPISSVSILAAFAPLGGVSYVSQSYLDGLATGQIAGRIIRSLNGSIYFTDSGIKLPFSTCDQVVDYGGSCNADGYVNLTDGQLAAFHTGPGITSVMASTSGAKYYISGGVRSEILDAEAQVAAGIPAPTNVLSDAATAGLRLGTPIVRDSVFIRVRGSAATVLFEDGNVYPLSAVESATMGTVSRAAGALNQESINLLPSNGSGFSGIVVAPGSETIQILADSGSIAIGEPGLALPLVPLTVSQRLIDLYQVAAPLKAGDAIKATVGGTVYVVMQADVRPIASWDALLALSAGATPVIRVLPTAAVNSLTKGIVALTTGALYRSSGNATVFLVNGVTSKYALSKFDFPVEAGFSRFEYTSVDRLNAYPTASQLLTYGIDCAGAKYVSVLGTARPVPTGQEALYPFTYVPFDTFTCGILPKGPQALEFIRTDDGSIYRLDAGMKRPISTWARFSELTPTMQYMQVSSTFASMIPTGAPV